MSTENNSKYLYENAIKIKKMTIAANNPNVLLGLYPPAMNATKLNKTSPSHINDVLSPIKK